MHVPGDRLFAGAALVLAIAAIVEADRSCAELRENLQPLGPPAAMPAVSAKEQEHRSAAGPFARFLVPVRGRDMPAVQLDPVTGREVDRLHTGASACRQARAESG